MNYEEILTLLKKRRAVKKRLLTKIIKTKPTLFYLDVYDLENIIAEYDSIIEILEGKGPF